MLGRFCKFVGADPVLLELVEVAETAFPVLILSFKLESCTAWTTEIMTKTAKIKTIIKFFFMVSSFALDKCFLVFLYKHYAFPIIFF